MYKVPLENPDSQKHSCWSSAFGGFQRLNLETYKFEYFRSETGKIRNMDEAEIK